MPSVSQAPRSVAPDPDVRSVVLTDRSGRYLLAGSIFTLLALVGGVLLFSTDHDVVGTVLLMSGDALAIITWVDYLRKPCDGRPSLALPETSATELDKTRPGAVGSPRKYPGAVARTLAVLFLLGSVAACDPSPSGGCQPATSFLSRASSAEMQGDTIVLAAKFGPKKRVFNCSKQRSPQWQKLKPYKGEVRSNGKTGKHARYYEWDATHNDIEVYGPAPRYKHLGSMDPITGRIYKDPVQGRNLRGKLK